MKRALTAVLLCVAIWSGAAAYGLDWANHRPDGRQAAVFDIHRDARGMVWLGTNAGLYSFDGYKAKHVDFPDSPFLAQVYSIVDAGDGTQSEFWLGTNNGVYHYLPDKHSLAVVPEATVNEIRAMLKLGNRLLIGSLNGLYIYDIPARKLRGPLAGLPHDAVYALYSDGDGSPVYVGTYNGLCTFDPAISRLKKVNLTGAYKPRHNFFVNAIARDPLRGCLWLGIEGALLAVDRRDSSVTAVAELNGNSVKSLAFTSSGKVVVGTDDGLFVYDDTPQGHITVSRHDSRLPGSIADNTVWSLLADSSGCIFAGTDVGLSVGDIDSPVRTIGLSDLTGSGEGLQIFHFMRDDDGALWIGGNNGLIRYKAPGDALWFRPGDPQHRLNHNRVRHISKSPGGEVLVSTDGGVNVYNTARKAFDNRLITDISGRLNSNWAYSAEVDPSDGRLWVGAYLGGVFVTDSRDFLAGSPDRVVRASQVYSRGNGLENNLVNRLEIDHLGNKWILLFRDSTLTRINPAGAMSKVNLYSRFKAYPSAIVAAPGGGVWCAAGTNLIRIDGSCRITKKAVFPSNLNDETVQAMALVDGELWISTIGGDIYAADTATCAVRLLPLPAMEYTAIYHDPATGRVLLGSVDRIVSVDPQRLTHRVADDRLHIVGITAGGKPSDHLSGEITLAWGDNSLSIELSTLNFTAGISRRFAYRLADIDSAWTVLPDGVNRIDLSNIPEGRHRLEMMVKDIPESVQTLGLYVSPPWYRSRTAYGVYMLALLLLVAVAAAILRRRQQRRIQAVERKAALEKVGERIEFLSNISHDLKTPLSMIIGPLSNLRDRKSASDPDSMRAIDVAYNNAIRLNELIHRTIELNHVEAMTDAMMVYSRLDAVAFCRSIFSSYSDAYPSRHFEFVAPDKPVIIRTDAVKLESVVNNLLSNAVKYSDDGSPIECRIEVPDAAGYVSVSIADRGIGIPEEERGLIFQRLFRSSRSSDRSEGTGLGLYLVKRYMEMLGGSVELQSHTGKGSVFTVTLPLYNTDDQPQMQTPAVLPQLQSDGSHDSRKRVLIVDDNSAIASFIAELLDDEYVTATAPDGRAALELMPHFRPDLIIADEMMPNMSGLEMVRTIKSSDTPGASVPVILLTAKTDTELESESVRSGVDMFMTKPFEAPLLKARVGQMLRSREKVRHAARIESITSARPIEAESDHERLLARITDAVETHIADTSLGVAMLTRLTGIPDKQLYRLLKRYVGVSPVDFIRQTRLRKAAMLLEQRRFAVSEVMYMVGFSSPGYFSKCFVALYGCTPSQYKNR